MVILAGDIGGTKTNLGLFVKGKTRPIARVIETYSNRGEKHLVQLVTRFLKSHPAKITRVCLGIAGPVINGRSSTTNLPWEVSESDLRSRFKWRSVRLINDLETTANAIPLLRRNELLALNQARIRNKQNIALMAPGTGLGQALLVYHKGHHFPIASEGGHADFSPNNNEELGLWEYLHQKYGHVSTERVVSGPGLINIYNWLKHSKTFSEPMWLAEKMKTVDPARVIAQSALDKKNKLCMKTLELFVSALGSAAGNLALAGLTLGGLYLAGGIPPKIIPKINPEDFMRSFTNKGRFKHVMEKIPVRVIINDKAALLGAARYALEGTER